MQRDEYTCRFCGHRGTAATLDIDHSIPVARGGTDHANNLQTACWACNALKGDTTTRTFEARLHRWFWSRCHFARYAASGRASGRLPDLDRWVEVHPPDLWAR